MMLNQTVAVQTDIVIAPPEPERESAEYGLLEKRAHAVGLPVQFHAVGKRNVSNRQNNGIG
jgi:hypothetical protein